MHEELQIGGEPSKKWVCRTLPGSGAVQQRERAETNESEVQLQHPEPDMPNAQHHTCKTTQVACNPCNSEPKRKHADCTDHAAKDYQICNMSRCGGMLQ